MFAFLKSITTAANKLGRALAELSDTVSEINGGLRAQVGVDKPEKPARVRGKRPEVIDHKPQADAPAA
jgi:hypothetical protein